MSDDQDRPLGLRKETLLQALRQRKIMAHEVAPIIDELLYLRERFNTVDPASLSIPDLEGFLSSGAGPSRALWAANYMHAAAAMNAGETATFTFGDHVYILTKKYEP